MQAQCENTTLNAEVRQLKQQLKLQEEAIDEAAVLRGKVARDKLQEANKPLNEVEVRLRDQLQQVEQELEAEEEEHRRDVGEKHAELLSAQEGTHLRSYRFPQCSYPCVQKLRR